MEYSLSYRLGAYAPGLDPDARAYIAAVEAADGQALEGGVKTAYDAFIRGCKSDGIWDAIKASCILAGARTLSGALVPLKGAAPTNFNFVSADYNRKTGLIGNGSTKYLNSNRNNNADPQDSKHHSVFISSLPSVGSVYNSGGSGGVTGQSGITYFVVNNLFRVNNSTAAEASALTGFNGSSRSAQASFTYRIGGSTIVSNITSETPINESIGIFARTTGAGFSDARLAFYSIGESLNLALLDSRVTTLISDLAAAIP